MIENKSEREEAAVDGVNNVLPEDGGDKEMLGCPPPPHIHSTQLPAE